MNAAPCGYVVFSDDGTVTEVNQTLLSMLGYARLEVLGWHLEKLLPPGGRIFYHTHLLPILKLQGAAEELYFALRTKDGRDIPVLLNAQRKESGGEGANECVVMRMLQRHEFEDQLLAARRLAEEASAAKGKFLAMMSHDLRTPLTTIYGNASLLETDTDVALASPHREHVEAIKAACRSLSTMIGDILEYAQLGAGQVRIHKTVVPVDESIDRALTLVRVSAMDAGVTLSASSSHASAEADPDKLQQILLNLLGNAIKFTPRGGYVEVLATQEADRVLVHVRDTGIGIAAQDLPNAFSPFVQLDAGTSIPGGVAERGVGLGLAISRELARAMGGDVTAESEPGRGSVFTIHLPAAAVAATATS